MKGQRPEATGTKKDATMNFRHWILCIAALLSLSAALGFFPKNEQAETPGYEITRSTPAPAPDHSDAVL